MTGTPLVTKVTSIQDFIQQMTIQKRVLAYVPMRKYGLGGSFDSWTPVEFRWVTGSPFKDAQGHLGTNLDLQSKGDRRGD